jgi:hypothetical protein
MRRLRRRLDAASLSHRRQRRLTADAAYAAAYAAYAAAADAAAVVGGAAWREARTRSLRDLCQTIALATRDAIDAAAEGYARVAHT